MRSRFALGIAFLLSLSLAVACAPTEPREFITVLEVAPDSIACVGAHGPQKCLRVNEWIGGDVGSGWRPFFNEIEGFVHEPGFNYVLIVAKREISSPPQDASGFAYRLLTVDSKTAPPN